MKRRVSFDFDDTLDRVDVQEFVKTLPGYVEPWIVTSRLDDSHAPVQFWNSDLYTVADFVKIPRKRIVFTNYEKKSTFFAANSDFIFHLDDDYYELVEIQRETNVIAISVIGTTTWKNKINRILKRLNEHN